VPFDADVGPDANGDPGLVYSRCAVEPPAPRGVDPTPQWDLARRCKLYEVPLAPGGHEHALDGLHLAADDSATTPTMWHGTLAFAVHRQRQRFAQILLKRGTNLTGLTGGLRPTCRHIKHCRSGEISGGVDQMDLGPRTLVYLWRANGGDIGGIGPVWQLRQDRLTRPTSALLDSGEISGTCGYALPTAPNALSHGVAWIRFSVLDCGFGDTVDVFHTVITGAGKPSIRDTTLDGLALSLAIDGADAYWIRDRVPGDNGVHAADDCINVPTACDLMRSPLSP
jgi:hypothetical protein